MRCHATRAHDDDDDDDDDDDSTYSNSANNVRMRSPTSFDVAMTSRGARGVGRRVRASAASRNGPRGERVVVS